MAFDLSFVRNLTAVAPWVLLFFAVWGYTRNRRALSVALPLLFFLVLEFALMSLPGFDSFASIVRQVLSPFNGLLIFMTVLTVFGFEYSASGIPGFLVKGLGALVGSLVVIAIGRQFGSSEVITYSSRCCAILLGFALTLRMTRKKLTWLRFAMWSGAAFTVLPALVIVPIVLFQLMIFSSYDLGVTLGVIASAILTSAILLNLAVQPFVILMFVSPYYRRRLYDLTGHLPPIPSSRKGAPPTLQ